MGKLWWQAVNQVIAGKAVFPPYQGRDFYPSGKHRMQTLNALSSTAARGSQTPLNGVLPSL